MILNHLNDDANKMFLSEVVKSAQTFKEDSFENICLTNFVPTGAWMVMGNFV